MTTLASGKMSYMRGHDFNTRRQQVGELVKQYILALYSLIQDCNYSQEQKEQVIRNRLVIGMQIVCYSILTVYELENTSKHQPAHEHPDNNK